MNIGEEQKHRQNLSFILFDERYHLFLSPSPAVSLASVTMCHHKLQSYLICQTIDSVHQTAPELRYTRP